MDATNVCELLQLQMCLSWKIKMLQNYNCNIYNDIIMQEVVTEKNRLNVQGVNNIVTTFCTKSEGCNCCLNKDQANYFEKLQFLKVLRRQVRRLAIKQQCK